MKQHSMAYLSAFCVTAISARWWPVLPAFSWLIMSAILVAVIHIPSINKVVCSLVRHYGCNRLLCCAYKVKPEHSAFTIFLFSGMLSGMIWMGSVGHWYLFWQLPELKIQQDVILTGRIVEIRLFDAHQQALLAVEKLDHERFYGNALLYIDNEIGLFQPHQHVQFHTKLKPASTLVNPATDARSSL
ncbi:hypothetical protein, partial [Alteromonas sp. 14N.309.X.WAT.G.H12]|uniref:hypothetical protein n=1 Tax=Alteromonas sp. 14N.309.X.WAT.G.H12 TaxID=3120824 RepID=UPI002FD13ADA